VACNMYKAIKLFFVRIRSGHAECAFKVSNHTFILQYHFCIFTKIMCCTMHILIICNLNLRRETYAKYILTKIERNTFYVIKKEKKIFERYFIEWIILKCFSNLFYNFYPLLNPRLDKY